MALRLRQRLLGLLPRPLYALLRRSAQRAQFGTLTAFASHPALSWLYFTFVRPKVFAREGYAVLSGRRRYAYDHLVAKEPRFFLRRNIHRIEKGLIMRPRRPVFATDYIVDTVKAYGYLAAGGGEAAEQRWAHDVLSEYFAVVAPDPQIDLARSRFADVALPPLPPDPMKRRSGHGAKPYLRCTHDLPSRDALLVLAEQRRSVRWYKDASVPRELLDRAFEVAALSPSACNRQPFEFRVFDDRAHARRIGALPMGTGGFAKNFPAVVVLVGRQRAYFDERDRHLIYIDGALAAMSFMLALETVGLSSCPINWPDVPRLEMAMARELSLAPDERVIMLMSVGYADPEGAVPYSQKRPLDDLRRYEGA